MTKRLLRPFAVARPTTRMIGATAHTHGRPSGAVGIVDVGPQPYLCMDVCICAPCVAWSPARPALLPTSCPLPLAAAARVVVALGANREVTAVIGNRPCLK